MSALIFGALLAAATYWLVRNPPSKDRAPASLAAPAIPPPATQLHFHGPITVSVRMIARPSMANDPVDPDPDRLRMISSHRASLEAFRPQLAASSRPLLAAV